MTLDTVPVGAGVVVTAVHLPAHRRLRLAELGVRQGRRLLVLGRTVGGGRVLAVGDARLAVDHRTSTQVVTRLDGDQPGAP